MTEDQLISALDALERGAQQSLQQPRGDHKPYYVYVNAMQAVIARYRETNPYVDTDGLEVKEATR